MKAIVRETYGPPDVLHLEDVPVPALGDGDVLVRIRAASANAGDWHLLRGTPLPFRLVAGLRTPRFKIIGTDVAGHVEAVGRNVTQFRPGDEVFGELSRCGFGAYAEFAVAPEKALALKPVNLSFEEAAALQFSPVPCIGRRLQLRRQCIDFVRRARIGFFCELYRCGKFCGIAVIRGGADDVDHPLRHRVSMNRHRKQK